MTGEGWVPGQQCGRGCVTPLWSCLRALGFWASPTVSILSLGYRSQDGEMLGPGKGGGAASHYCPAGQVGRHSVQREADQAAAWLEKPGGGRPQPLPHHPAGVPFSQEIPALGQGGVTQQRLGGAARRGCPEGVALGSLILAVPGQNSHLPEPCFNHAEARIQ